MFTGRVYGETHASTGIAPFERVLGHCLAQPQYEAAERIFLIVDNGSSHHPSTSPARIRAQYPQVTVVHLPLHSSWLNQIELYFSIVHRKALTPADFDSVAALARRLAIFQWWYNARAEPFQWNYTREKLEQYVARLAEKEEVFAAARAALEAKVARAESQLHPIMN